MNGQKLVITGANGFLGRQAVTTGLARGYHVVALARNTTWLSRLNHTNLTVWEWDAVQGAPPTGLLEDATAICHMAAFIPPDMFNPSHAEMCLRVNALGTLHLLEAAVAAKARRFVFFASGNGYAPQDTAARENDSMYPAHRATFYLASKLTGELYTEHFRLHHGLPATVLRLSAVYGPEMTEHSMVSRFAANLRQGQPIELADAGRHTVDLVWAQDVIRGGLDAIEVGADGVFNIGSGESSSVLTVATSLAEILGADPALIRIQPASSHATPGFAALDISKAQSTFAYQPTSLKSGLRQFCLAY